MSSRNKKNEEEEETEEEKEARLEREEKARQAQLEIRRKNRIQNYFYQGFYYPEDSLALKKWLKPMELPSEFISLHRSFGYETWRRNNIHYIEFGVLLYIAGNTVQIYDNLLNIKKILTGHGEHTFSGIGAIAVHPNKSFFAVAECGEKPNIYIYSFPSLHVVRILRNGTERTYSDIKFSHTGKKLASVGGDPDYLLTVWDWQQERVILRTKAFAQEVFTVQFSPVNEGRLITCGQGHIRFWKMAATFTGLKLQGAIGKFGNVELTDISAFVELPDGSKVLSGTETGNFLMWDGGFIQFEISKPGGVPCHDGAVEVITLEDRTLITAGADGYVKRWKFESLEYAETTDDNPIFELQPVSEIKIGENVHIKGLIKGKDHWLVLDANGGIYKLWTPHNEVTKELDFPAQALSCTAPSPSAHVSVTGGLDGVIRCWDILRGTQLYSKQFESACTSMCWAPDTVDPEQRTLFFGFEDGVVRVVKRYTDNFQMVNVLKPHNKAVSQIAIDPIGQVLATSSVDGSVFFISIRHKGATLEPLGFVSVGDQPVQSMSWKDDSSKVLLACGAEVIELDRLDVAKYESNETRDTYQIELKMRRFRPDINIDLILEPELAAFEEEQKDANDEEEEDEEEDDDAREERLAHKKEMEDRIKEARDAHAAMLAARPDDVISAVVYDVNDQSKFHLSLHGGYGGYDGSRDEDLNPLPGERFEKLYTCSFTREEPLSSIDLGQGSGTVTYLGYSLSADYLLIGFGNGSAQVRPIKDIACYFAHQLHQGYRGGVSGVITSFDDSFFISIGQDGQMYAHTIDIEPALKLVDRSSTFQDDIRQLKKEQALNEARDREKKVEKELVERKSSLDAAAIPSSLDVKFEDITVREANNVLGVSSLTLPLESEEKLEVGGLGLVDTVEDILAQDHYSIEEAKLKQEEDDRIAAAEKKKDLVRREIEELREEFAFLKKKNLSLDPSQRLPADAFELDPKLRQQLEIEAQAKIDKVRAELAWISEKHTIALTKLRNKFLDPLIVEYIKMSSFRTNISVSCFRTPELPPFLRESIEAVHKMITNEENQRKENEAKMALAANIQSRGNDQKGGLDGKYTSSRDSKKVSVGALRHRQPGVSEAELRKKAREERKKELERLKASKPDRNVDDPRDVARVREAINNMGDKKLKSDPNYKVPENQRVNAERKRRQMVLLQESVHFIKMALNERFLAMRDLKKRIINNIKQDNVRLRELNELLGIKQDLYEPEIDPSEWPEHRELYTKADLIAFEKFKLKEAKRLAKAASSSMFRAADTDDETDDENQNSTDGSKTDGEKSSSSSSPASASDGKYNNQRGANILDDELNAGGDGRPADNQASASTHDQRMELISKSPMEEAEERIRRKLLEHERRTLLDKIEYAVDTFDQAVAKLRREKFKLDADLKTTDLKILTLYEELNLLKGFEENENRLLAKLKKARAAKAQVVADMSECEKLLAVKHNEIKLWHEKDVKVMNDFMAAVGGDKSEFYPQLLRIFKKKVKRSKKRNRHEDLDDDDDSDADDGYEDSDDGSDDETDSDDDDDDACPDKCDNQMYEKVLELREKRLEQEDDLNEFNKQVSDLNKTNDRHEARERTIDKELVNTEEEIEEFQSEKQRALNQIFVTVPLKLSQMKYLDGGNVLPQDISNALIFTSTGLERLRNRIQELIEQKVELSNQYRSLKRGHKQLVKELQSKRELIAIEKKKCEDVQMLKFGQIIDLSILAKVGVDEGAAELRRKLKTLEANSVHKLNEWDQKILDAKDELAQITQQNTAWLERVALLTKAQYDLEDQLNTTTKNVHVADTSPVDEKDSGERRQLLQLVQIQEKEIDALKAEIHVLRRKGGHVYTPQ